MSTLYNIVEDFLWIEELAASGDVLPEDLEDTIEAVHMEMDEKLDAIASVIKNLEASASEIKKERERLEAREKSKIRSATRLKEYIATCLSRMDKKSWENTRHAIAFRKSQSLKITDEEKLLQFLKEKHPSLVRVETFEAFEKNEVKKLISKEGEQVDGAEIEERQNLQLK